MNESAGLSRFTISLSFPLKHQRSFKTTRHGSYVCFKP